MNDSDVITWDPYLAGNSRLRITETSCCGVYEWACQGGQYLVLRQAETGQAEAGYEEAGRGIYSEAREVWDQLVLQHRREDHRARGVHLTFP